MRDAIRTLHAIVLILWPLSAAAAAGSLGSTLASHSFLDWASVGLLSTVSGLVALLTRIKKNMEAAILEAAGEPYEKSDKILLRWQVFAVYHMAGCYMAGFLGFFFGEYLDWDGYMHAIAISLFAWLGATLLDAMAGQGSRIAENLVEVMFRRKD